MSNGSSPLTSVGSAPILAPYPGMRAIFLILAVTLALGAPSAVALDDDGPDFPDPPGGDGPDLSDLVAVRYDFPDTCARLATGSLVRVLRASPGPAPADPIEVEVFSAGKAQDFLHKFPASTSDFLFIKSGTQSKKRAYFYHLRPGDLVWLKAKCSACRYVGGANPSTGPVTAETFVPSYRATGVECATDPNATYSEYNLLAYRQTDGNPLGEPKLDKLKPLDKKLLEVELKQTDAKTWEACHRVGLIHACSRSSWGASAKLQAPLSVLDAQQVKDFAQDTRLDQLDGAQACTKLPPKSCDEEARLDDPRLHGAMAWACENGQWASDGMCMSPAGPCIISPAPPGGALWLMENVCAPGQDRLGRCFCGTLNSKGSIEAAAE